MSVTLSELLDNIHILTTPSRSVADIAGELDVEEGAVINPLLCSVEGQAILVLMAGDKACDAEQVSKVLNAKGEAELLSADAIEALIGAGIDSLFPLELAENVPTILDASLKRFDLLYSRAGNAKCLIATTFDELKSLTEGVISYAVASPPWHPRMPADVG